MFAQSNLPACQGSDVSKWSNCVGNYNFTNGSIYVGEFKDGKYNGQGTLTTANGDKYVGEWRDGKHHGYGTLIYSDGTNYVGEWRDGKHHGYGTYAYADGNKYAGNHKDGLYFGQGTLTLANGDKYVGEYRDDKLNGQGTYTFANGNKYVGEFKDNKRNGQGTEYASNGSIINQGVWANGIFVRPATAQQASSVNQTVAAATQQLNISPSNLPACQGRDTAKWSNCFGIEAYPSGSKYAGEFINGKPHGLGAFHSSNGIISEGVWADGKFIRSAPVQQATTSATLSNSAEIDRLSAEVQAERKKRQELEAQLAASVQPAPSQTNAPRRIAHALVIGNGAYPGSGRLDNPVNDANAISQKLRSMGFIVTTVTDANRQRLVQSMAQFRRTAASADISLLYYAGHGVQIFGTNYILPTDVDQTDPAQATIQGVSLNSVVENFLPGKTKLVFLDACRDNALQRTNDRSVSKGLAPISAAEGTLISYATKDGQTAADGVGSKNSPFTQALLEHLNDPQDIAVVLRKVRERVMKITGGKQQPWEYGSLTGGELVLSAIKPK